MPQAGTIWTCAAGLSCSVFASWRLCRLRLSLREVNFICHPVGCNEDDDVRQVHQNVLNEAQLMQMRKKVGDNVNRISDAEHPEIASGHKRGNQPADNG